MRKRARLRRERKIKYKILAYMVITAMSIILFGITHSFANSIRNLNGFGGELMILLTPILVSLFRANIKLTKKEVPEE
ncbi:MAG: hypothetical protein SO152_02900 [Ruminococcus sp.]|nr:hypothetical protein [Ruminococcus sp.]